MKLKGIAIVGSILLILEILTAFYVFDKLNNYKKEIARLYSYHTNVQKRQQEDIEILFNRLNYTDARWQDYTERLEKIEWWSCHRY